MAYLDQTAWKDRTLMPGSDVDALEALYPGWVALQLDEVSDWIDSRLRKRYAAPFESPYPKAVLRWLTAIVTRAAYLKRGFDPNDAQVREYIKDAETAQAEIREAADGETGLFDLPLRADVTATGITKGGPLGYSESSPYVGFARQADAARVEDANRRGSGDA